MASSLFVGRGLLEGALGLSSSGNGSLTKGEGAALACGSVSRCFDRRVCCHGKTFAATLSSLSASPTKAQQRKSKWETRSGAWGPRLAGPDQHGGPRHHPSCPGPEPVSSSTKIGPIPSALSVTGRLSRLGWQRASGVWEARSHHGPFTALTS